MRIALSAIIKPITSFRFSSNIFPDRKIIESLMPIDAGVNDARLEITDKEL